MYGGVFQDIRSFRCWEGTPLVPKSFIRFSEYGVAVEYGRRAIKGTPRYTVTTTKCQKLTNLNLDAWKRFDDVTKLMPSSLPIELKEH